MYQHKVASIYTCKHILNNKGLDDFLKHIENEGITYEKVPPHMHWLNAAEKSIQAFKNTSSPS